MLYKSKVQYKRSRKLGKTLWASVSPRNSERQPCQDTPVPNRQHRQTKARTPPPLIHKRTPSARGPHLPTSLNPGQRQKTQYRQAQRSSRVHDVKSPYTRPMAKASPHTACSPEIQGSPMPTRSSRGLKSATSKTQ